MNQNYHNLENHVFYRLVKVIYITLLIISCFCMLALGSIVLPIKYVDYENSFIVCEDGVKFSLENIDFIIESNANPTLNSYDDEQSRKICSNKLEEFRQRYPMYNDMSDQQVADNLYNKYYSDIPRKEFDEKIGLVSDSIGFIPNNDYTLILNYTKYGSWLKVLMIWFFE